MVDVEVYATLRVLDDCKTMLLHYHVKFLRSFDISVAE